MQNPIDRLKNKVQKENLWIFVLILLNKIQLYKLQLMSISFSFFLPISGILILIAFAIFVDTTTGIWKSIKLKKKVTSRGLSQIISKIMLYEVCVLLFYMMDKFILSDIISQFFSVDLLTTKILALTLCSIEVVSINERRTANGAMCV